jgi:hypothetical protein
VGSLVLAEATAACKKEASRDAVGCGELSKECCKDVDGDLGRGEWVVTSGYEEGSGMPGK